MSNFDKAARVIRDLSEVDGMTIGYAHAHNIAQALADAGLLAPDLTEPHIYGNGEKEWNNPDGWINLENGDVTIYYSEYDGEERPKRLPPDPDIIYFTNPTHLRWLALDMLAAANHLEQERA